MHVDLRVVQHVSQMHVISNRIVTLAHEAHVPVLLELPQVIVLHFARGNVPKFANAHLHASNVVVLQGTAPLVTSL